ncbi:MAG: hypothetical protein P1U64_07265 [Alcanivoracaceae bacterium]|nr:hypothetical protein [Alcanivoracaceae bacterium]
MLKACIMALAMSGALLLSGCDMPVPMADETFGRQNFVSAVALIELHKTRTGDYPASLDQLQYLGDWDQLWLSAVRYEKQPDGYNLFIERGWANEPDLSFPPDFKRGLGIRETNVAWRTPEP